jgi:TATA-binding protein-associated factor
MGLGKTLQALVGVAIAHNAAAKKRNCCSLVVCPSTLVGHWLGEIEKYFPVKDVFQPLIFVGNRQQRVEKWRNMMSRANIVVTSYAYLRSDIELLSSTNWCYCILDEGHLLRNPKTGNN